MLNPSLKGRRKLQLRSSSKEQSSINFFRESGNLGHYRLENSNVNHPVNNCFSSLNNVNSAVNNGLNNGNSAVNNGLNNGNSAP